MNPANDNTEAGNASFLPLREPISTILHEVYEAKDEFAFLLSNVAFHLIFEPIPSPDPGFLVVPAAVENVVTCLAFTVACDESVAMLRFRDTGAGAGAVAGFVGI